MTKLTQFPVILSIGFGTILLSIVGIIFAHFIIIISFYFKPFKALFLLFHDISFALSPTLLPMLGPKFSAHFVFDSNGGFRSRVRLTLNV